MAFWNNFKDTEQNVCSICRQPFDDGRNRSNGVAVNYMGGKPVLMCRKCFERGYRNSKENRNAASVDVRTNFLTQYRPAEILEKPLFKSNEKPECDYEYSMPHVSGVQVIRDIVVWCILLFIIKAVIKNDDVLSAYKGINICHVVINVLQFIVSLLWCIRNAALFGKGILYGMGHIRRIFLIVSIVILAFLTYGGFTAVVTAFN
ncbi:MAG: hypothetical protein NC177_12390 [Ruminococcus flavefaciens]|nr:hypothetical protein [Ruminococcus flavefaciens]